MTTLSTAAPIGAEERPTPFLPTEVAAGVIGMSPSWLEHDRQKAKPEIPFVRIGARSVRYRVSDLLAYAERRIGKRFTA